MHIAKTLLASLVLTAVGACSTPTFGAPSPSPGGCDGDGAYYHRADSYGHFHSRHVCRSRDCCRPIVHHDDCGPRYYRPAVRSSVRFNVRFDIRSRGHYERGPRYSHGGYCR